MKRVVTGLLLTLALAAPALAEPPYLDDRSDAEQLIRSLYNAVNRHEYARAYDYFVTPPSKSYEAYVKGYEDTETVDVLTGTVTSDGAAGSIYYIVPTAIRAKGKSGTSYFAGCYTIKAVNGAIQDPPSRPLQIQSAKLKPSTEGDYTTNSLPDCAPNGESSEGAAEQGPPDAETMLAQANERFVREMSSQCEKAADTRGGANPPQVFQIEYKDSYAGAEDPPRKFTLFAFACSMGAYNSGEVYYGYNDVDGLVRLSFAAPHLDIAYEDEEQSKLKSLAVNGFETDDVLVNSEYSPESKTINFFSKWRGIGDASSNGEYQFRDGRFVLVQYDVDPTTDEKMNSFMLIRDGKVLPAPEAEPEQ